MVETSSGRKQRKRKNSGEKQKTSKRLRVAPDLIGSLKDVPGNVLTFGTGDTGQLGLGPDMLERKKPTLVKGELEGVQDLVQVCCGGMHTIGLTKTGRVFSWGCNDEGSLGRKTEDDDECTAPDEVTFPDGTEKVVAISAGDSHSAAVTTKGRLFFWGGWRDNSGSMTNKISTPVHVPTSSRIVKISSGYHHLVMLSEDGTVLTMGCGENGQLGRVAERFSTRDGRHWQRSLMTPAVVPLKHAAREAEKRNNNHAGGADLNRSQDGSRAGVATNVWAGGYTTMVKLESGLVFGFGLNSSCQLGFKSEGSGENACVFKPAYLPRVSALNVKQVSCGHHHTLFNDEAGNLFACGSCTYGACGLLDDDVDKEKENKVQTEPKKIESIDDAVKAVAAGIYTSYAVTEKGDLWSWGTGTNNALGHGDDEDYDVPTKVESKQLQTRRATAVSAGGQHCALVADEDSDKEES